MIGDLKEVFSHIFPADLPIKKKKKSEYLNVIVNALIIYSVL